MLRVTSSIYYVLDEEKIKKRMDKDKRSITIRNVKYDFNDSGELISARPIGPRAMALTKSGYVMWKNPSKEIYANLNLNKEPVCKEGICNLMCNGYICIGSVPPKDRVKITKNNIAIYGVNNDKLEILPFVNFAELGDEMFIDFQNEYFFRGYYNALIGVNVNDKFIPFTSAFGFNKEVYDKPVKMESDTSRSVLMKIITKGTCYRSRGVVLCYE